MIWWMNWSRNTSSRPIFSALPLAALLLGAPRLASGQDFDQRLKHAMELQTNGKDEEACDAFKLLGQEKPGDKNIQAHINISCTQVKADKKMEEDLFTEGAALFDKHQYADARQKFEQAIKDRGLKTLRYKEQVNQYMARIDTALKEDTAFQDAVNLYKAGNKAAAHEAFAKLAKANGSKAAEAQDYLRKIEQEPPKEVAKQEVPKQAPKQAIAAGEAPSAQQATAGEQTLRAGLRAYFAGNLDEAERDLADYLAQNGPKRGLAYFFRGAVHGTRYFLSGEKESHEKDLAVADFEAAKNRGQGFQPPPQKYISPKILALYSQAPGAVSP